MSGEHFTLVKNTDGYPPEGAVQLAEQTDEGGRLWTAVAHTEIGDIPGKAKMNSCWYSCHGGEHETDNFSWVINQHPSPLQLVENDGSGVPDNALRVGHQTNGFDDLYAAVAISEWGTVPGKAHGETCWFPCHGKEHETNKFYWVCHQ